MKILIEHLRNNEEILQKLAKSIGVAKHAVNLGTAREGLIANFLENNLPENIKYHSGEIFDSREERSGQVDIILHPISSPKIHLHSSINLFPVETVLAAIEVKSRLDSTEHIKDAFNTCLKVKKLHRVKHESYEELITGIPFIIFAYKGCTPNLVEDYIQKNNYPVEFLPDLIVNIDRGYYLVINRRKCSSKNYFLQFKKEDGHETLLGLFYFLLKRIENWSSRGVKTMPIDWYIRDEGSDY